MPYNLSVKNMIALIIVVSIIVFVFLFHVPVTSEKIPINCFAPPCDPPFILEQKTIMNIIFPDVNTNAISDFFRSLLSQEPVLIACPLIFAPVCGTDGQTFDNECLAESAGVEVANTGMCLDEDQGEIICIALFDPVCGVDGMTYSNECFAMGEGIAVASQGECPVQQPQGENFFADLFDGVFGN